MSLQKKISKRKRDLAKTGALKSMFQKALEAKEKRRIKKFEDKCRKAGKQLLSK